MAESRVIDSSGLPVIVSAARARGQPAWGETCGAVRGHAGVMAGVPSFALATSSRSAPVRETITHSRASARDNARMKLRVTCVGRR